MFDDEVIVGSANLNYRSLENDRDFELAVLVKSPDLAQQVLRGVRDVDLAVSRQITATDIEGAEAAVTVNSRNPITIDMERIREL